MSTDPELSKRQRVFNERLIDALEKIGILYAICGSVAAMSYSEARYTIDVDVMIEPDLDKLAIFVDLVESWEIYIAPLESILEIDMPNGLPFNIVDGLLGVKGDFYLTRSEGLDASAMSRRKRGVLYKDPIFNAWFLSPEDVILYKMIYFKKSDGTLSKHPTDIGKMLAVMGDQLDIDYIQVWCKQINLTSIWNAIWSAYRKYLGG